MKTPHKHAEFIKAWAEGNKIEYQVEGGSKWWAFENCPQWTINYTYRIKPEPEYPKTTLPDDALVTELVGVNGPCGYYFNSRDMANKAIRHFIESGDMDRYIAERDGK